MSAFVVDKDDIDLLVDAALHAGHVVVGSSFQWWQTGPHGEFGGWRYLAREQRFEDDGFFTPSMLGQMLVSENVRSVSYRYGNEDAETLPGPNDRYYLGPYVYGTVASRTGREPSPGQVFRTIDRLDYQSCEHPEWRETEAFAFLFALRVAYCRLVTAAEEGES